MTYNKHIPVLLDEVINYINVTPDGVYIDFTLGSGGHSYEILKQLSAGKLYAFDRDEAAIRNAEHKFEEYGDKLILINDNFKNVKNFDIRNVDGIIADLGVSSEQIDNPDRGFSYMHDAPLDMRMCKEDSFTAKYVVNTYDSSALKEIMYKYGEERYTDIIVKAIIKERENKPINTTGELSELIKKAVAGVNYTGGHPAKRTFQAIRIHVNGELDMLGETIKNSVNILKPGGRMCIITFNSLEDRIVKKTFAELAKECVCPPNFPICICNKKSEVKLLTKKALLPSESEMNENPRSKSAKLRVAEKV